MRVEKKDFGQLESGQQVTKYLLINNQLQVNVLNYGGIITEIYTPDKEGTEENIVLGFDNIEDYEEKSPYFGAIIGRHAGRIENAEFKLDGKKYNLAANEGSHNLHGGIVGLDKKIWQVKELDNGIELTYVSPHLEEGFPAEVEFTVKYLLKDKRLIIEYRAEPDRETIINLTNHSYFNLSGAARRDILNQQLKLKAEKFISLDEDSIPTGELQTVQNTPFDFREFKRIGKEIETHYEQLNFTGGYDHPFILEEKSEGIILKEQKLGRKLTISTDQPAVVFYSGNYLKDEGILNSGVEARKNLGVCLETQDYPNAVNIDNFPTRIYNKTTPYKTKTEYAFTAE